MVIGRGSVRENLSDEAVRTIVRESCESLEIEKKRVLVIIPDGTRSMPMPRMFDLLGEFLAPRAAALDFLVASGTHPPMSDAQLGKWIGRPVTNGAAGPARIFNHEWADGSNFVRLGVIPAGRIRRITDGLMEQDVPVSLNKRILDYDQLVVCGPVFPHEVVGFSGGNKYFFPGIAGPEIIHFTHWLGALITNRRINGAGYTPVRAVIDLAAGMIDKPKACLALVVRESGTAGLFFGSPADAWKAAADLSAQVHIVYVEKPLRRVLSIMPEMYDDLWTAAKGMYKMEPAMADGGEVVIFAPRITEVSYTHGRLLDEIGYHCRDYFLKQWDKFRNYPGGVLAHSTHLAGAGEYDPATGVEKLRIRVTLATGIPAERCRRINVGYMDPKTVNLEVWRGREAEGVLVVPRAGEMLYRLKKAVE
jgi:nickel-dependent lactate racemase